MKIVFDTATLNILKLVSNPKSVDNKGRFTNDGLFSTTLFGSMKSIKWECLCGKEQGKFLQGTYCQDCLTPVNKKTNIDIAYIDIGDSYIIAPIFFNFFLRVIPGFLRIINFELNIDENGEGEELVKKSQFDNIGILEFQRRFDEIIKAAYQPKYESYFKIINENRDKIFINKIPIINSKLRPAMMIGQKMIFDEINKLYTNLIMSKTILDEAKNEMNKLGILFEMQLLNMKVADYIMDNIANKEGLIRNNLLGYRVNWSARAVIAPAPIGCRIDQIKLPYLTMLELYKFQILNLLSKIYNIDYVTALGKWNRAIDTFDQQIFDIMDQMVKKGKVSILLNRNPTINYGSIVYLNVSEIKREIKDYTINIHNLILKLLAADYDGDTLNIIGLINREFREFMKPLNPKNMVISPQNAKFNTQLSLDRDVVLGLYTLTK